MSRKEEGYYKTDEYRHLHQKLVRDNGKAYRCENPDCQGKSKRFDWAIKKGVPYSLDTNDYTMLCRACHCAQDSARGEVHCQAKLTEDAVRYIRQNAGKVTQIEMAGKFGVRRQTISLVVQNKNWKHV